MNSSDDGATKPFHVLEGSTKDSLDALFNVLRQPQDGGQLPLHKRNLPKSFFHPPNSQQGSSVSTDNISFQSGSSEPAHIEHVTLSMAPQCFTVGTDLGLVIAHSKAHSMPAALQGTIISGIEGSSAVEHSRQSSDVVPVNIITSNDLILYTHGNTMLTTATNEPQKMVVMKFQVCRLPDGWELALDDNQLVYFINHNNQTTSWFDPRLPETFQSWGMTLETLEECHLRYAQHLKEQVELKQRQQQQQSSQTPQLFVGGQKCTPLSGGLIVPSPLPLSSLPCSTTGSSGPSSSSPQPPPQPPAGVIGGMTPVQHSHQSSLDSGMASGQSTTSASHTPEHNAMSCEDVLVSKNVGTSSPVDSILEDLASSNFRTLQDEDILSTLDPMMPMEDYNWSSEA